MPPFSAESERVLTHVHPDLQRVVRRAITIVDFKVQCGLRNKADQEQAVRDKASKAEYPLSNHNRSKKADGTYDYTMSDAVDVVPWPVQWPDARSQTTYEYGKRLGAFYLVAGVMLMAAAIEGVKIRWGGTFKSFFDGPHFERIP